MSEGAWYYVHAIEFTGGTIPSNSVALLREPDEKIGNGYRRVTVFSIFEENALGRAMELIFNSLQEPIIVCSCEISPSNDLTIRLHTRSLERMNGEIHYMQNYTVLCNIMERLTVLRPDALEKLPLRSSLPAIFA